MGYRHVSDLNIYLHRYTTEDGYLGRRERELLRYSVGVSLYNVVA